jgi:hypothetical protein
MPTAAGDNPWRDEMLDAYMDVFEWAQDKPDLAEDVAAASEGDVAVWVTLISQSPDVGFARKTAEMVRRWAILNKVVWLYEWPKPVSVMSDDEIIKAARVDGPQRAFQPPG